MPHIPPQHEPRPYPRPEHHSRPAFPPQDDEPFEGPITSTGRFQLTTAKELKQHTDIYSPGFVHTQYLDLATDTELDRFLDGESFWDKSLCQWVAITTATTEQGLRSAVKALVNKVILALGNRTCGHAYATREAVTTDYGSLEHLEHGPFDGGSAPAIVIRGSGPSFEVPEPSASKGGVALGYSNAASCFDVFLERDLFSDDFDHVTRSGVYARQMYIQQPNRRFVRNLLVSEEFCQLIHFDRTGAQYTPCFNIHNHPKTFIRLLLGLSSFDETLLGLDTAIEWDVHQGRKVRGSITITNAAGGRTRYPLADLRPTFCRHDLVGRATTGWRALMPNGVEVFVKDYWRSAETVPEYRALHDALGIDGAAQMVDYESVEVSTAELRSNGSSDWAKERFRDRISTRIVMELYDQSIVHFKTQRQLFAAVRDAMAAHQRLVNERQVLHRDISQDNIRLGHPGARVGKRGILTDFDMAMRGPRPLTQGHKDPKVGTLRYMSVSMLSSHHRRATSAPNHDQLDDLESFYYVIYDLMCTFEGVGQRVAERPWTVQVWEEPSDPADCAPMKKGHFVDDVAPDLHFFRRKFWLPPSIELVCGFYRVLRSVVLKKYRLRFLQEDEDMIDLQEILASADECYSQALALFDKAIEDLREQEGGDDEDLPPTPQPPSLLTPGGDQSPTASPNGGNDPSATHHNAPPRHLPSPHRKRSLPQEDTDVDRRKRSRTQAPPPLSPPMTRARARLLGGLDVRPQAASIRLSPRRTRSMTKALGSSSRHNIVQRSQTSRTGLTKSARAGGVPRNQRRRT